MKSPLSFPLVQLKKSIKYICLIVSIQLLVLELPQIFGFIILRNANRKSILFLCIFIIFCGYCDFSENFCE